MRKIIIIPVVLISFLLLSSIVSAQLTPLDIISNFLNSILSILGLTTTQEKVIPSSGSIVYDNDWGFIPEGYEIVFADDVEHTTWDGSTGDNPNLHPWVDFFSSTHDGQGELLHKQILSDSDHKWYGDGNDWYSTTIVRRGNRAFRVNRDGQYPDPGDRMQLMSRFHTEYVWYGTWIYFPTDFELDEGWFTFGGIISGHPSGGWLFRELTLNRNMDVRVNYRKDHGGGVTSDGGNWFTGITIPKGEWVHFGYIVRWHQTEGYMKFYLNGQYVSTFEKNVDPAISDAVTRWDGNTFFFFTMKHYSHEHDYETVYWDDLVFAVPQGTEW